VLFDVHPKIACQWTARKKTTQIVVTMTAITRRSFHVSSVPCIFSVVLNEEDEQDAHGNGDKPLLAIGVLFRRAIARR
jgi:hypothetical protein